MIANIRYTRPILRSAIGSYIRRLYLKQMLGLSLAGLLLLGFAFWTDSTWHRAFIVVLVSLIPSILVLGYWMRIRQSLKVLDMLDDGRVSVQLDEDGVTTESAIGLAHLKWKMFTEVWDFPKNYLLLYTNHQFITLPKDQVSEEFVAFIRKKIIR